MTQIGLLAISTVGFLTGTVLLKYYADGMGVPYLLAALAFFIAANLIYAHILTDGMGRAVLLSSMSYQIGAVIVGMALFGERLTLYNASSLILSCTALWLVTLSANASQTAN